MAEKPINWFGTTSVKLHLTFVWVCVASLVVGVLIYRFAYAEPGDRTVYVFIASALGVLTGILTLLARLYQGERRLEQAKRTAALDFIFRWTDPRFDNTRQKVRDIYEELKAKGKGKTGDQMLTELRQDKEKWASFVDVANFFEVLGIALHHKEVDEKIVKDFFRGIITRYWNVFKPLIEARRAEQENNFRLYQWFQALHDQSMNQKAASSPS